MVQSKMSTEKEEKENIHSQLTEDEIEVCEILVNFANLIVESELRFQSSQPRKPFLVKWGTQKRLICPSRGSTTPSLTTTTTNPPKSPSSSLPSLQKTSGQEQVKIVSATSPNTPLSLSNSTSSESNEESKKRNVGEQLKKSMKGLAESKEVLIKEVENVRSYYNELLAYNAKLKAKKQQVLSTTTCHTREEPKPALNKSLIIGTNCVQSCHRSQLIVEQMTMEPPRPEQPIQFQYPNGQVQVRPKLFSSSTGLGMVSHLGPLGISHLSAATATGGGYGVASSQPLDDSRVLADNYNRLKAAEARRNRKMKNHEKRTMKLKLKAVAGHGMTKPPPSR